MNGFYSSVAGATLRWHDFPGDGLPVVFIHGLGCASSYDLSLIHISEPTRLGMISYAVFCLKKKKKKKKRKKKKKQS